MSDLFISRADLVRLLAVVVRRPEARVLDLLTRTPQDRFRLGRQPADRTQRTFELKYGMAKERGVHVEGLPEMLENLALLGSQDVAACVVEGEHAFGLVVLDPELVRVESALYAETPERGFGEGC